MTSILKRNVAAAVVAATVLGGGAAAFATEAVDGPARPTLVAETAAQAAEAPQPPPDTPAATQTERRANRAERRANRPDRPGRPNRPGQHLARRAVHGDLIVRGEDGEFENVTFDRGRLTSVSGGSLTLERGDGVSVTVTLNDSTRYRGVASAEELRTGRPVFVASKDGIASVVAQPPEREARVPNSDDTE